MELETYFNFIGWRKEGMNVVFEKDDLGPGNCIMGTLQGLNSQQVKIMQDRFKDGYSLVVAAREPV